MNEVENHYAPAGSGANEGARARPGHRPAEPRPLKSRVESFVAENPVMVGVVGLAAGLIVGALLPSTRRENRAFGRYADEVRDQGLRYARDLAEQGKHYVAESLDRARPDVEAGLDETQAA